MEYFKPLQHYCLESYTVLSDLVTGYQENERFVNFVPINYKVWFPNLIELLYAKNKILIVSDNSNYRKFGSRVTVFKLRPFVVSLRGENKPIIPTDVLQILTPKVLKNFDTIVIDVNRGNETPIVKYLNAKKPFTTVLYPGDLLRDYYKFLQA